MASLSKNRPAGRIGKEGALSHRTRTFDTVILLKKGMILVACAIPSNPQGRGGDTAY